MRHGDTAKTTIRIDRWSLFASVRPRLLSSRDPRMRGSRTSSSSRSTVVAMAARTVFLGEAATAHPGSKRRVLDRNGPRVSSYVNVRRVRKAIRLVFPRPREWRETRDARERHVGKQSHEFMPNGGRLRIYRAGRFLRSISKTVLLFPFSLHPQFLLSSSAL